VHNVLKFAAWTAGIFLVLFLLAGVLLYFVLPRDEIIARILPPAEEALGRQVELGDAGISFWPPFGVFVSDLRVANEPADSAEHMLKVSYARAQLAWQPLLTGEFHFSTVELSGVEIVYERLSATTTNVSDLTEGDGGGVPILAEHMTFEDLSLIRYDRTDTTWFGMMGTSGELHVQPDSALVQAVLQIPGFASRGPDGPASFEGPLQIDVTGQWLDSAFEFQIRALTGKLAGAPLQGSGSVFMRPEATLATISLSVGPHPIRGLLSLVPDEFLVQAAPYTLGGEARVDVNIDGALDHLADGAADLELVWLDGQIGDSTGELARFESLSIPVDAAGFHVDASGVVSRYGPMQVAVVGTWPPESRIEASVSGEVDASTLVTDSLSMAGLVGWSASAQGPLQDPGAWRVKGRATTASLSISEGDREPFVVSRAAVSYNGRSVRIQSFDAAYAASDLSATGEVNNLVWRDLLQDEDRPEPEARLEVRSSHVDLDALFPHLAGDSAAPADTGSRPPLPLGNTMLDVSADTMILGGATWTDMTGRLIWHQGSLSIDTLYGGVYGGTARLKGRIDSALSADAPYLFNVRIDSLALGQLLTRFGRVGNHLQGRGSLKAQIAGRGATPEEILQRLAIDGTAHLFDAQLVNLGAAARAQELLGLVPRDPVPLKSRWNSFRVQEGRTRLDDFQFKALDGAWVLAGSAGLDGTLDYALDGTLPPDVSSRLSLPDAWFSALPEAWRSQFDPVDLLKNDAGEAEFYLHIGGTLTRPNVSIDWARLQPVLTERFERRVKDRLTDEVESELKKGLQDLFNKLKP
jgi:AsmA protein